MIKCTAVMKHSDGNFSAEASDARLRGPIATRHLVEEEPGVQQWYELHRAVRDREGDVLYWEYRKVGSTTTLTIFND